MNISEETMAAYEIRCAERKLRDLELDRQRIGCMMKRKPSAGELKFIEVARKQTDISIEEAKDYLQILRDADLEAKAKKLRTAKEVSANRPIIVCHVGNSQDDLWMDHRVVISPVALAREASHRNFQYLKTFAPGQHCRRFWDPKSDNDTGCYLTPTGVLVFVPHDKPFMSWSDIFGPDFVRTHAATHRMTRKGVKRL